MTADAAAPLLGARLQDYVQTFDDALDANFCATMIDSFERLERFHQRNGRDCKPALADSAWTELNVTRLSDIGFQQSFRARMDDYLERYNARVPLTIAVPQRPRIEDLRMKRYRADAGDRFQPHFDAIDAATNRYLVFLWYLNDVADGGETEFCDLGLRVQARRGRLLMFPPYWMFQHAGRAPRSNDKYIVSTYLTF
jgi:hypothetical protein